MAADAGEVVVGSGGKVYIAPVGTTEPAGLEALSNTWKDLGYISEDGITASFGITVEDINAFQSLLPIRRVVTGRTADLSFVCRQWNADTFSLALGGGTFYPSGANFVFEPPANDAGLAEHAVIVDWSDGSKDYRLIVRKAAVTDAVETQIVRNAAADLPITLSIMGDENSAPWYLMTNDEAFDA